MASMRPVVAPRRLGDVAERELGARVEVANDDVGARGGPARRIAAQRDVRRRRCSASSD